MRRHVKLLVSFALLLLSLALLLLCAYVPGAKHILAALFSLQSGAMGAAQPAPPPAPLSTPAPTAGPDTLDEKRLRVFILDVGQGNCALLISPSGKSMLVDAGEAEHAAAVRSFLRAQGIEKLDLALLSHMDSDHAGTYPSLLRSVPASLFCLPAGAPWEDSAVFRTVAEKEIPYSGVSAGMTIPWDEEVVLTVLSPQPGVDYPDENEQSLVLHVRYGNTAILFAGDAGDYAEDLMLSAFGNGALRADLLVLGHHGSSSSTTPRFLRAVSPQYALISCGLDNSYGHPHQSVLNLLESHGVGVYRTDLQGTCAIEMDGTSFTVQTEK